MRHNDVVSSHLLIVVREITVHKIPCLRPVTTAQMINEKSSTVAGKAAQMGINSKLF